MLQTCYLLLIISLLGLFVFHIFTKSKIIEGVENKSDCDSDSKTLVYKNAGTISSLQEKVDTLMKQVNKVILDNDTQTSKIQTNTNLSEKNNDLVKKAGQLALDNKQRLLDMAQQSKSQMDSAQKESDSIKFE